MPRGKPRAMALGTSASHSSRLAGGSSGGGGVGVGGGGAGGGPHHRTSSTSSSTSSSRITIKPFSKPPSLPPNYYETSTRELLDAPRFLSLLPSPSSHATAAPLSVSTPAMPSNTIATSTTTTTTTLNLQESYTTVVHLVSHQLGERLYNDLRQSLYHAARLILPDSAAVLDLPYVCHQYSHHWLSYLMLIQHVFLPLDRTHYWNPTLNRAVRGSSTAPRGGLTLWGVGLRVFADRLHELQLDAKLYEQWKAGFLEEWREGTTQTELLQSVWYMWGDLGWLSSLPLQRDLEEYWRQVAQDLKRRDVSSAAFLQFCVEKHCRVGLWSAWLPCPWLWNILEQQLIAPHLHDTILQPSQLHALLSQQLEEEGSGGGGRGIAAAGTATASPPTMAAAHTASTSSLTNPTLYSPVQQLWMLASRLPKGQELVAQGICGFARAQGTQIVGQLTSAATTGVVAAAAAKPSSGSTTTTTTTTTVPVGVSGVQVVADLLSFQDRLGRLIASLPHHEGVVVLKSTWEQVLNHELMAENLAKFLDQVLRNPKKMDQHQNNFPKIIANLFVPLAGKDVFEAFYKRDLAKRLLWNRIVSMDVEKSVCTLLKAECGAAYTSKMEGMFQDVDWSRETMMLYKQSQGELPPPTSSAAAAAMDMDVQVLTTGYWPVYPQFQFHLPQHLLDPQERFETYYKKKYQGRRVTWQYALGHCVVKANGLGKAYEFIVSLCQALVLLQFNEQSVWTLPELMKQIGMQDREEMERVLQSLSVAKEGTRILKKLDFDAAPKKKKPRLTVDDKDQFQIFEQFESNQRRIRINNIMMKESKEEREKTVEGVARDRLYLIDAVLVRILKARKTILHQNLIQQVLEQVKVPATAADVKRRIESLIEREYMERDPKDRNRYVYLA